MAGVVRRRCSTRTSSRLRCPPTTQSCPSLRGGAAHPASACRLLPLNSPWTCPCREVWSTPCCCGDTPPASDLPTNNVPPSVTLFGFRLVPVALWENRPSWYWCFCSFVHVVDNQCWTITTQLSSTKELMSNNNHAFNKNNNTINRVSVCKLEGCVYYSWAFLMFNTQKINS